MISKVRFLLVFGIVLAAVLIGEGKYAEDEGGLSNFGETSRIKKRSVWGLEPESDEEIECPRPRKEFWHPKFKKCVPYCGRNVKRDKFTGLCKENVETPQMFAWNNQHNQHGLYPRIGQRSSRQGRPSRKPKIRIQGIRKKMEEKKKGQKAFNAPVIV